MHFEKCISLHPFMLNENPSRLKNKYLLFLLTCTTFESPRSEEICLTLWSAEATATWRQQGTARRVELGLQAMDTGWLEACHSHTCSYSSLPPSPSSCWEKVKMVKHVVINVILTRYKVVTSHNSVCASFIIMITFNLTVNTATDVGRPTASRPLDHSKGENSMHWTCDRTLMVTAGGTFTSMLQALRGNTNNPVTKQVGHYFR